MIRDEPPDFGRYDARMETKTWAAAAVLAAAVLSGCSGPADGAAKTVTITASPSTASYSLDSWKNWGRAGVEWLSKCGDYSWGCVDDESKDLLVAAKSLPPLDASRGGTLTTLSDYRDLYRRYVSENCKSIPESTAANCTVKAQQLVTYSKSVRKVVAAMASN